MGRKYPRMTSFCGIGVHPAFNLSFIHQLQAAAGLSLLIAPPLARTIAKAPSPISRASSPHTFLLLGLHTFSPPPLPLIRYPSKKTDCVRSLADIPRPAPTHSVTPAAQPIDVGRTHLHIQSPPYISAFSLKAAASAHHRIIGHLPPGTCVRVSQSRISDDNRPWAGNAINGSLGYGERPSEQYEPSSW
jgi:hypothetical protein